MGSLAQLAVAQNYRVTGCDANVYPPMSTQLEQAGIELIQGFDPAQLELNPDLVVIGNAMKRGNPLVEAVLDRGIPYVSGPQWLSEHILRDKWVLAVSGTHGKTTTTSMLAWILEHAKMSPGYLIGGVPRNFDVSARLGETAFFVIEADEYDSAFFDKRSKFVHYQPRTLIINNIEFDHGDIFDDLAAIQKQFHHLVRIVPSNGLVVQPASSQAVDAVIEQGCWTARTHFSVTPETSGWSAKLLKQDGSAYDVLQDGKCVASVHWGHLGSHNVANGIAAIAAAHHVGVRPDIAAEALVSFKGVKRRMECLYQHHGLSIYDDFAHHPTAIQTTLAGLRANIGDEKIVVLIEPRSNTMRMGCHQQSLATSCDSADHVLWYNPPDLAWDIEEVIDNTAGLAESCGSIEYMLEKSQALLQSATPTTPVHIVIMSNGGFNGLHQQLIHMAKELRLSDDG